MPDQFYRVTWRAFEINGQTPDEEWVIAILDIPRPRLARWLLAGELSTDLTSQEVGTLEEWALIARIPKTEHDVGVVHRMISSHPGAANTQVDTYADEFGNWITLDFSDGQGGGSGYFNGSFTAAFGRETYSGRLCRIGVDEGR